MGHSFHQFWRDIWRLEVKVNQDGSYKSQVQTHIASDNSFLLEIQN